MCAGTPVNCEHFWNVWRRRGKALPQVRIRGTPQSPSQGPPIGRTFWWLPTFPGGAPVCAAGAPRGARACRFPWHTDGLECAVGLKGAAEGGKYGGG